MGCFLGRPRPATGNASRLSAASGFRPPTSGRARRTPGEKARTDRIQRRPAPSQNGRRRPGCGRFRRARSLASLALLAKPRAHRPLQSDRRHWSLSGRHALDLDRVLPAVSVVVEIAQRLGPGVFEHVVQPRLASHQSGPSGESERGWPPAGVSTFAIFVPSSAPQTNQVVLA